MTVRELKKRHRGLREFELVPEADGVVWLWGYGTYGRGSVLAGQYRQSRLEAFDSLEEAKKAYPRVKVRDDGTGNLPASWVTSVSDVPPPGFSEADAGERW
jgi:hypothetical protein